MSDGGSDVVAGKSGSYFLLINSCNYGCPLVLKKFNAIGTETLYKIYQYPGGLSYSNFALPGRMRALNGNKIAITGNSYLRENNTDIYLSRLDTNGIAYTTSPPAITASGPITFCNGDSVTLQASTGTLYSYYWKKFSNQIGGENTDQLVVKNPGTYKVGIYNQFACMKESAGMQISVPCREGNEELNNKWQEMSVFPNPNNGIFNLMWKGNPFTEVQNLTCVDIHGRVIDMLYEKNNSIQLLNVQSGMYFLKVETEGNVFTKKLIVE